MQGGGEQNKDAILSHRALTRQKVSELTSRKVQADGRCSQDHTFPCLEKTVLRGGAAGAQVVASLCLLGMKSTQAGGPLSARALVKLGSRARLFIRFTPPRDGAQHPSWP